jgi:soluble epoxide hydrolase/lipid-phosphate phosphatase
MDPSLYKTQVVSRGIRYSYYFSPAKDDKRTMVFLHGFPSTSKDWLHQVAFFVERGYGALVPDMIGYGGTDKPTIDELEKYSHSAITQDVIDLMEYEHVGSAVAVGHDWYDH